MQTIAEIRKSYLAQGYSSLGISTRTGAEILRNAELGRVVKLTFAGKDPSVSFARWIREHPMDCFPNVIAIVEGEGGQGDAEHWRPCAIEMEELGIPNDNERDQYRLWVESYLEYRAGRSDQPEDTLGLLSGLDALFDEAENFGGAVAVEIRRSKTVMVRQLSGRRQLVVLDPWY